MILAAHQPQYLAYSGYFDKIDRADIFVLLDTVQYKKNEWINRNRLKSPTGAQFITVPVSFNHGDLIKEVKIASPRLWQKKHLSTLKTLYSKAPHFKIFYDFFESILNREWRHLSDLNIELILGIYKLMKLPTDKFKISSQLPELPHHPDNRLIELCRFFHCETYLAGAGGKDYMDLSLWEESGIEVKSQNFREPVRPQLHNDFIPNLSIADLFMNLGEDSLEFLRNSR